jgi:general secretion pathway protein A
LVDALLGVPVVRVPGQRPLLDLFPPETLLATPFGSSDLRFLYRGEGLDRVTQEMLRAIGRRDPVITLTGELGVGKTMLCRALVEQLDRHTLSSFMEDPPHSVAAFLRRLLVDLGVVSRGDAARGRLTDATQVELTTALRAFLASLRPLGASAVVIIDDAQRLPGGMLDEIHAMAGTGGDGALMQMVLVGEPDLITMLGRTEMLKLAQRASLQCRLGPLTRGEVAHYITHRLQMAEDGSRVGLDEGALAAALYALSRGLPRTINLICERAIVAGFDESDGVVDESLIRIAANELGLAMPPSPGYPDQNLGALLLLALLVVAGAAAGAYVFRADLQALVAQWKDTSAALR